jgi:hypothetical protein
MLKSASLDAICTELHGHNLDAFQNENSKTVTPGVLRAGRSSIP